MKAQDKWQFDAEIYVKPISLLFFSKTYNLAIRPV